jgi:hypothetical protein
MMLIVIKSRPVLHQHTQDSGLKSNVLPISWQFLSCLLLGLGVVLSAPLSLSGWEVGKGKQNFAWEHEWGHIMNTPTMANGEETQEIYSPSIYR